jgi:hypothetical protein
LMGIAEKHRCGVVGERINWPVWGCDFVWHGGSAE